MIIDICKLIVLIATVIGFTVMILICSLFNANYTRKQVTLGLIEFIEWLWEIK